MKRDDALTRAPGNDTTATEDEPHGHLTVGVSERLALVLVWSKDEPWRMGEAVLLSEDPETTVWLGRGPSAPGGPPKGILGQHRPGSFVPGAAIGSPAISRYQVAFRKVDDAHVAENEGRCPLFVNAQATSRCEVKAGDVLQLGKQLVFLCTRRPDAPPADEVSYPDFAFGGPDAHGLVGESWTVWQLRRRIASAAAKPDHVIVWGSSGAGKELVSHAIHALSRRGGRRMVSRNAATLPESLIDAELFGNPRGYPNPGIPDRPGLIGEAHGSTLFLDELAELPQAAQAHLLRVLDAGEYQRLGEAHSRVSDFRLVAATNRDLAVLKADLLARFSLRIAVPDLDARREDLPLLVRHALRRMGERGDAAALALFPGQDPRGEPRVPLAWVTGLLRHRFRTNVREIEMMILEALEKPEVVATWGSGERSEETPSPAKAPATAEAIRQCLDANNGSIERTWRALGLSSRFSLLRLIKKFGLEVRRRPAQRQGPGGLTQ